MLEAFEFAKQQQVKAWHVNEAPVALLTSVISNSNRDPKKRREPFKMEDFFLFQPRDSRNIPTSVYGAAAMALVAGNNMPPWALFVFKDLKEAAEGQPPQLLAFICENAILLAPVFYENRVKGMLIALESASSRRVKMESPCGRNIYVEMPSINGKYYAQEDVELVLIN